MQFLRSEKAVSEVVGQVFILSLTIVGVAAITLFGVPSIYRLEDMADVRATEQAFTAMDSRVSSVIIGDSPMKTVNVNLGGGILTVVPNSTGRKSYIVIKSENNTFNITIPMGKLEYTLGDRIVAYEGGGIWTKYPSGGSVMVAPPEFHYDGRTLTLPVPAINGNANIAGKGTTGVTFEKNSTLVLFPDTIIDPNRTNPLNYSLSGKVYVNITSDFYDAWADYAKSLLYTNISTDPASRTTKVELTVVPSSFGGRNVIPNPISIRGLPTDDTPLDNFSFRIYPNNNFHSINWDIRAHPGNKRLIYQLEGINEDHATIRVGYEDDSLPDQNAEIWSGDVSVQGDAPNRYIDVDLLNNNTNLIYKSEAQVGNNNMRNGCQYPDKINGGNFKNTAFSWDNMVIDTNAGNPNSTQSLYNITQHYFWILGQNGDFFFNNCQNGNNGPDPSSSSMVLGYNATGALTFLQISQYNVKVDLR